MPVCPIVRCGFFHIVTLPLHHAFPMRSLAVFFLLFTCSLSLAIEFRCAVVCPPCVLSCVPSCVTRARLVGSFLRSIVRNNVHFLVCSPMHSELRSPSVSPCVPVVFPPTLSVGYLWALLIHFRLCYTVSSSAIARVFLNMFALCSLLRCAWVSCGLSLLVSYRISS